MTSTDPAAPHVDPPPARIVGIGASAGGLSALRAFLRALPADTGLGYVVVAHLSGALEQNYVPLLQSHVAVPVVQAEHSAVVKPDHVYLVASHHDVLLRDGALHLCDPEAPSGGRAPIDRFLRSLASALDRNACAVILSGNGSDGSIGVKRVKEVGGLAFAQDPDDAEYDGMPRSAISTGLVDLIIPAREIPGRLLAFVREPDALTLVGDDPTRSDESLTDTLRAILTLVRLRSGHDFSNYKRATLLRRIARRMQVCETPTIGAYLAYLRERPMELAGLLRDFLISVTNFFRDPEVFRHVEATVIPRLFEGKGGGGHVRIWVAGCATGEEAYTLAILCAEHAARLEDPPAIQIFATDIDEEALVEARAGRYPETIAADVTPERLDRFFVPEGPVYRVRKELREIVLFSPHNLLRDPPFSRLDLISCRNLLIYLDREAQHRVLQIFHFGLAGDGTLLLGSSESAENAASLFATIDVKHRIYGRRPASPTVAMSPLLPAPKWQGGGGPAIPGGGDRLPSLGELHHRLVEEYAPPSVVVNEDGDVVHLSAHAGRYLTLTGGEPTRQLLRLVQDDLRPDLRAALYAVRQPGHCEDVRKVRTHREGVDRVVELRVRAFDRPDVARGTLLVMFGETDAGATSTPPSGGEPGIEPVVRQLEDELQRTREQLRTTVEQYETSVEELKASNEELHAINEELRSATEELETSKEELQSVNEELTTLNQELKDKVDEVSRANGDLQNLMTATEIGVLFLDRQLNIKRFTPRAQDVFNVIASDLGRPLTHVTHRLDRDDLAEQARAVLRTLEMVDLETRTEDGRVYLLRINTYQSVEDRVDGIVLSFLDITGIKQAEAALRGRDAMLRMAEHAASAGFWELDVAARTLRMTDECRRLYGFAPGGEDVALDACLERIVPEDRERAARVLREAGERGGELDLEVRLDRAEPAPRSLWVTGRAIIDAAGRVASISGISIDVSARRHTEEALRRSEARFRLALRTAPVMVLSQDLALRYTWGYMLGGAVDFVGKDDFELFGPAEAERLVALKRGVLATGVGHRDEVALTIGGRVHHYDVNLEPQRDDDGRVVGVASAAVDITVSTVSELAMRDADRRKDEFLATLAHELRNPLAPLRAALDIQLLAGDDLPRIDKARAIMERQLGLLVRLVDDLLDVSRITQGKIHLRRARVELSRIVADAVEAAQPVITQADHRLQVTLPTTPVTLDVDHPRMVQALTNLLLNAARYTPPHGQIALIGELDPGGALTLTVRDNGVGIAPDVLPHVFDLFTQAGDALERAQGGLGIGLNLVRRLVELHGGTVEAHSAGPGQGSEFRIRLPIARDKEHLMQTIENRTRPKAGVPRRVLVVDDNPDVTFAMCELLKMIGHVTCDAGDGHSALAAAEEFQPDVVLLDIGLPGLSGYEVARRLRDLPGGRDMMIVAITGWGQPDDVQRGVDAGFDHHIVKPASVASIREVVGDGTLRR